MIRLLAALALSLALVAGCAGEEAPSGPITSESTETPVEEDGPFNACSAIDAAEMSKIVGETVTAYQISEGNCQYSQPDKPLGLHVLISTGIDTSESGSIDFSKNGTVTLYDAKAKDLNGVGDKAYVVAGPLKSAPNDIPQGQGAVQVGEQYVPVTVTQSEGHTTDEIRRVTTETLELIALKLSL